MGIHCKTTTTYKFTNKWNIYLSFCFHFSVASPVWLFCPRGECTKTPLCDQCGKHFLHICKLKAQKRIHIGENPYDWDQCGQHFSVMSDLKRQRIHTGERPTITLWPVWETLHSENSHCRETNHREQCGKPFTQRIHTAERPTIPLWPVWKTLHSENSHCRETNHCEQCGKHLTQSIHTGEKDPNVFLCWKKGLNETCSFHS